MSNLLNVHLHFDVIMSLQVHRDFHTLRKVIV